jgi:hypothetical protein
MRLIRRAACALLCAALPLAASAQSLSGRITTRGQAPIRGGLVELQDTAGRIAATAATDSGGGYRMRAPGPGVYRLWAGQIGFTASRSAPFELRAGERREISLTIFPRVVTLEGVTATGRPRCASTPASGEDLARVWEEARQALALTVRSAADSAIGFDFATYLRTTETRTDSVVEDSLKVVRVVGGIPFASAPMAELDEFGFVRSARGRITYYGPDAKVLLSDRFLSQHCFSLRRGTGVDAGLVGLAFEPVPTRRRPDVSGVLWLDAKSSELRRVEWGYTRVTTPARFAPRGRADFVRLPGGAWIISSWWLRIPYTAPDANLTRRSYSLRYRSVKEVREVGGSVERVWVAKGAAVPEPPGEQATSPSMW